MQILAFSLAVLVAVYCLGRAWWITRQRDFCKRWLDLVTGGRCVDDGQGEGS